MNKIPEMIKTILKFILCSTGVIVVVFLLWTLIPNLLFWWFSSWLPEGDITLTNKGVFGDSFGGVNALLSGLALIGVITAIILQRQELKNQQEEMQEQKIVMQQETFERTFFHLLEMLEKKYNSMEYHETIKYKNRIEYEEIEQHYKAQGKKVVEMGQRQAVVAHKGEDAFAWAFMSEDWLQAAFDFRFYFSLFYSVLQFIDQANWGENKEKKLYADILRNQMSEEELVLLFNCACPSHYLLQSEGHIDGLYLKRLIENYSIFSILYSNQCKIGNEKNWKQKVTSYDISAFGPNPDDEIKAAFQEKDKQSL